MIAEDNLSCFFFFISFFLCCFLFCYDFKRLDLVAEPSRDSIAICHIGGALALEHIALEVGWIMNWVIYYWEVYRLGLQDSSRRLKRISQGLVRLHSSRSQLGTWYCVLPRPRGFLIQLGCNP